MDAEVVLITGCSTGIGRATATLLAKAGFEVVATARKPEALEGVGAAVAVRLAVVDQPSIESAVQKVVELLREDRRLTFETADGWPILRRLAPVIRDPQDGGVTRRDWRRG